MSSRESGLQAAKRRYKVLKRCDQNDGAIKSEIAALETEFPELLGLPPPVLSKETRATLEGGALVTSIEQGDGGGATSTSNEAAEKEAELREKIARVQAELAKQQQHQQQQMGVPSATTANPDVSADDVKKQIEQLRSIAKTMDEQDKEQEQKEKEEQKQRQNNLTSDNNNNEIQGKNYLQGFLLAMQAYDAFYVSTFPNQRKPDAVEAIAAVVIGAVTPIAQLAFSADDTNNIGLCSTFALTNLNPVVWASVAVLFRFFFSDLPKCFLVVSSSKQKRTILSSLPHVAASLLAMIVRLLLVAVVSFTIYSIFFVVLQAIGSGSGGFRMPARFCAV